jgi:hypothetical protein
MAPSRRSVAANKSRATPKRNKVNESSKDESGNVSSSAEEKPFLLLEDVTCKICLNLMVKPVSLPCQHNLCYSCYLVSYCDLHLLRFSKLNNSIVFSFRVVLKNQIWHVPCAGNGLVYGVVKLPKPILL